ncbi:single-stranded DNA-binding protein [Brachybacterium vulturis]|uniref:single-stranded DNA-binding protein n=1 Tax=Brachybacterium vulturis TaxID=2017484 RepID=UPI0037357AE4
MRDIQTTLLGNATADPIERKQADGSPSASVRIAVTGSYFNSATGDFADRKTEFITVFARRNLARNLLASVRRGQPLVVSGRLSTSEWTGEDETLRHSLNIQAEAIGHDLTYGTATFSKPLRDRDTPDIDPQTATVIPSRPADEDEETDTADQEAGESSYAPAF